MKRILFTLLLMFTLVGMFAAPAYRKPFVVKQSDGTDLTVVLAGDEAMHYFVTVDGMPLVKEANGDFCYATFNGTAFVSTKSLAHDSAVRSVAEERLLSSIDFSAMKADIVKAGGMRTVTYKAAAQKAGSQITPMGDVNVAVLLVQFKDTKFTYTKEDLNNILNTKDYVYENPITNSIGSARDYFIAQSDGKFRPNFIVTDIVTLDNNMSYYGANKSNDDDVRPTYMVKEGIQKADAAGFDFSICDNNGDGEVEFIYCIYAGYSESYGADANTIWPHQWQLSAQAGSVTVDGVKCDTYACSGELVMNESNEQKIGKVLAGIGLICHEFSHCLGLHDIYDTTYESGNWGMDYWDVMDQGNYAAEGYIPVGYSAYQRDFCGWRKLAEINEKGEYSMLPLTQGGNAYKVVNEANPNEYYILENRKQEGWDLCLFNSGMLVIHVDYLKSAWDNNTINTEKGHPRYTLIPADNELAVYGKVSVNEFVESLKGDVWPGPSGNTELTDSSTPAAKVYKGGYMSKPIRNIKYQNDVISFKFMYDEFVGVPAVLPATNVTSTSFVANWEVADEAVEYIVELYKSSGVSSDAGEKRQILGEDFANCTKANTGLTNETIDGYMSSVDWQCENVYSENGVMRIGSSKNGGCLLTPWLEASANVVTALDVSLYNSSKDNGVVLTIEYYNEENEIISSKDYDVTAAGSQKISSTVYVDGYFYVAVHTYNSTSAPRANIDNIDISYVASQKRELVTTVETAATSYEFKNLDDGAVYYYRVKASDGDVASAFSDYVEVALLSTEINEVVSNSDWCEVYTISGVKVYTGSFNAATRLPKGIYIVKNGMDVKKVLIK